MPDICCSENVVLQTSYPTPPQYSLQKYGFYKFSDSEKPDDVAQPFKFQRSTPRDHAEFSHLAASRGVAGDLLAGSMLAAPRVTKGDRREI
jgi:hypothetical protein